MAIVQLNLMVRGDRLKKVDGETWKNSDSHLVTLLVGTFALNQNLTNYEDGCKLLKIEKLEQIGSRWRSPLLPGN
jgi:hypothetical protein